METIMICFFHFIKLLPERCSTREHKQIAQSFNFQQQNTAANLCFPCHRSKRSICSLKVKTCRVS